MFLFRWLKKLFFLVLFVLLIFWAARYPVGGKPLYQVVKGFFGSESSQQSYKDLKMLFGGFLKSLGEKIQEDVTEEDQKELEKLIQKKAREKDGSDEF